MNTWCIGLVYSSIFLTSYIIIEYFARMRNANREYTRRIAHVSSSLFGLAMGIVMEEIVFITMCLFFLIVITISLHIKYFSFIHNVKRKTYGELILPLGILVSYLVANDVMIIFTTSVLILAIADPIAGMIGDVYHDSYALRTLAFFLFTMFILLILLPPANYPFVFLIASSVTIIERISPYGTDNLTIPFMSSVLLKLLLQS